MTSRPISVQTYSCRAAIDVDLPGALQRLADLGFTEVELYGVLDRAEAYAKALTATGLTAPAAHIPIMTLDEPGPAFETAASLGVRTVVQPLYERDGWDDADAIARAADRLNELAGIAAGYGLAVGYHNHDFEVAARHGDGTGLDYLAARLDPAVVLEVDTFWAEVAGVPATELLARLGDRVRLIHVKDGPLNHETIQQLPAGQGAMDVPAVLAAAPQAARILEFDDYDGDVFEALAASAAFVREHDVDSDATA